MAAIYNIPSCIIIHVIHCIYIGCIDVRRTVKSYNHVNQSRFLPIEVSSLAQADVRVIEPGITGIMSDLFYNT